MSQTKADPKSPLEPGERRLLGAFFTDVAQLVVGDPCKLISGAKLPDDAAPAAQVNYFRYVGFWRAQGTMVPGYVIPDPPLAVEVPDARGQTCGFGVHTLDNCDGWLYVYLEADDEGAPGPARRRPLGQDQTPGVCMSLASLGLAQLRHLFTQLKASQISHQPAAAEGLVAPGVRALEYLMAAETTLDAVRAALTPLLESLEARPDLREFTVPRGLLENLRASLGPAPSDAAFKVAAELLKRRALGLSRHDKYVDPNDPDEDWDEHLRQELLDGLVYLQAKRDRDAKAPHDRPA